MSISLGLVLLSALAFLTAQPGSVLLSTAKDRATIRFCIQILAVVLALGGAIPAIFAAGVSTLTLTSGLAFRLDAFSGLLICNIALVSAAMFSYRYGECRESMVDESDAMPGLFLCGTFLTFLANDAFASFAALVLTSCAATVLSLSSKSREISRADVRCSIPGFAGSILIGIALLAIASESGTAAFENWRTAVFSSNLRTIAFGLAFAGVCAYALLVPNQAGKTFASGSGSPVASALVSGVWPVVCMSVLLRLGFDVNSPNSQWLSLAILAAGSGIACSGAIRSCIQSGTNRILEFSSFASFGVMTIGMAVALAGQAMNLKGLNAAGLLSVMFGMLNHLLSQSLLHLSAGSVRSKFGSDRLDAMGGLMRLMPWTMSAYFVGVLGITALPPLNGFYGAWITFEALFRLGLEGDFAGRLFGPLTIALLGFTGALTLMGYVKAFGLTFLGAPRTPSASTVTEVALPMRNAQAFLAALCIAIGLGSPAIASGLREISVLFPGHELIAAGTITPIPGDSTFGFVSNVWVAILLAGFVIVPFLLAAIYASERPPRKIAREIWATGYAPEAAMHVSASGFTEPVRFMLTPAVIKKSLRQSVNRTAPKAAVGESTLPIAQKVVAVEASPVRTTTSIRNSDERLPSVMAAVAFVLILTFWLLAMVLTTTGGR